MMETWRLSKIEEELEKLEISPTSKVDAGYSSRDNTPPNEEIYSKIVIHPAYGKPTEKAIVNGIKNISEKYDSLGRGYLNPGLDNTNSSTQGCFHTPGDCKQDDMGTVEMPTAPPSSVPVDHNPCASVGITDHDILQADMFYRSHKTEVHVCASLANLYFGAIKNSNPATLAHIKDWKFSRTGIPLVILDTGESRRKRKMYIILSERGTGFTLWKDHVDHLTNYKAPHPGFHTMHLSSDHTQMAGFSFDDTGAATEFLQKIIELTSDPNDEILHLSGRSSKKKKKDKAKQKTKSKPLLKADISQPCCFTHVTKVDKPEVGGVSPSSPAPVNSVAVIQRRLSGIRQDHPKDSTL